jgi:DNA primase
MSKIRESDIALVKNTSRIQDIVSAYVNLKPAGAGSFKGLCPFHDERTPSFHVTPARGFYYCFGCQESGDVVSFLQKMESLTFIETIEKLAKHYNITLHYEEGSNAKSNVASLRARIVAAHELAIKFYASHLSGEVVATTYLRERGFDEDVWKEFEIGYSPEGWDGFLRHAMAQGFTNDELLAAGLLSQGSRGTYDRFRGRLMFPIRDLSGDAVGFGARKLHDKDEGPKYLNTPETAAYKKSQLLYGMDRARKSVSQSQQVVIVEGYTDVMACHLAGITNAVATCGTAFGVEHIRIMRRLLHDDVASQSQVIFTFDGDEAGKKAALKAFEEDQKFVAQTYVAIEPAGMDPCELRQKYGDEGLRNLIAARVPMFEFVIRHNLSQFDLNIAENRAAALSQSAPIVGSIKDPVLRNEYIRNLAGWLGVEIDIVKRAIATKTPSNVAVPGKAQDAYDLKRVEHRVEYEALKVVLQHPDEAAEWYQSIESEAFTSPALRAIHEAVYQEFSQDGFVQGKQFSESLRQEYPLVAQLLVEPLEIRATQSVAVYVTSVLARLLELDASRRIADLKGQVQRAQEGSDEQAALFSQLIALEQTKRFYKDHSRGQTLG